MLSIAAKCPWVSLAVNHILNIFNCITLVKYKKTVLEKVQKSNFPCIHFVSEARNNCEFASLKTHVHIDTRM